MIEVKTRHPQITEDRLAEWRLVGDAYAGESAIKRAGEVYLPKPSAFDGTADPAASYRSYMGRAQFPEIFAPTISAMVGIVHSKDARLELPAGMDFIRETATKSGLTLDAFHRGITRHLLMGGRYGVLVDAPSSGGNPRLCGYAAGSIINWDDGFYVLDETDYVRDGFTWELTEQYRILELAEGRYQVRVFKGDDLGEVDDPEILGIGNTPLSYIPFTVANARDILPDVQTPPLIGVARAAKAIYQLYTDKRHQLYMSGQETLVAINGQAPEYVGAGVVHEMYGADGVTPDLKYVGPNCGGIEAHERAIIDEREAAVMAGARMLEQSENIQESGSARKLRFASETANLMSVALSSYGLLEASLRDMAEMLGHSREDVQVAPPEDLMDHSLTPADAEALVRIWQSGGLSYQTVYERLQHGGIASQERSHDEEFGLIDDEEFRGPETGI